jgi:rubrerythrin
MSKTNENLKEAFAGESQASRKYHHFAAVAEKEGHTQVAKLFRAAALAETIHAGNHLKAMGGINSTKENLQAAIEGENYEVVSMYPEFIQNSEAEGEKQATRTFKYAWEVEKEHEILYKQALETLGSKQEEVDYYICPICGHTHVGKPTAACPVCGYPAEKFIKSE